MVVPKNKTFLVMPIIFKGPCKFWKVYVQIEGTVVAPDDTNSWNRIDPSWLLFQSVSRLNILGSGEINGRGQNWWKQSCKVHPIMGCSLEAPTAIMFVDCNDLRVRGVRSVDSAQMHMVVLNSRRVTLSNIKIVAPEDSPNTDGIHIQNSKHILIESSSIGTGDDCISIGNFAYDVHVDNVVCGPGHGISIGSLGKNGAEVSVGDIYVYNSSFIGTVNGVRIKTWQGGKGFARGIRFEHCNFTNVENPIIIDQYYCDVPGHNCKIEGSAVQISNVTYANLQGTSQAPIAVSLNCSQSVPCTLVELENVDIKSSGNGFDTKAQCINAYGHIKGYIHPVVSCLG